MISFKGMRFSAEIIIMAVRWYISYQLSYRDVQEMLAERGVIVNHSSVFRWVMKYVPQLEKRFLQHKKPVGRSWRMDETYVRVGGEDKYLYRAVDKEGNTVEFLLTARRNAKAARRYLRKAMKTNGRPRKINIDKSAASTGPTQGPFPGCQSHPRSRSPAGSQRRPRSRSHRGMCAAGARASTVEEPQTCERAGTTAPRSRDVSERHHVGVLAIVTMGAEALSEACGTGPALRRADDASCEGPEKSV